MIAPPFGRMLGWLLQMQFPPALRIEPRLHEPWLDMLVSVTKALLRDRSSAASSDVITASSATRSASVGTGKADGFPEVTAAIACALANAHFRLRSNLRELGVREDESNAVRGMKRALSSLDETFRQCGIECRDLTGEAYDPGRLDFEQLGTAVEVQGLERPIVGRCERPAVFLQGRLIQKAKGLAHRAA
jgi:hypothetical protein